MATFIVPRTTVHGLGSLDSLKELSGKKAVVITDEGVMKKLGHLDRVVALLKQGGIESAIFEGVEENPSYETVKKGAAFLRKEQPDIIVSLGGGSAIDGAKAMWIFYEYPDVTLEEIIPPFSLKPLRNKAIFVAIPTTSGTGTEVTCVSVITVKEKGVKYPIVSYELTPDIAIVDGELCKTMPPHVTAATGLDALTHDTEAFVSTLADPYTDCMAAQSVKMVFEYLPRAFERGDDLEARQAMHDAATLAGMSFTNALLGIIHAMAHQLGGMFSIPHGVANAILMPNIVRFNSHVTKKYEALAHLVGKSTAEEYACEIERLRSDVNVPGCIKEWGLDENLWNEKLDEITQNAIDDPCCGANPAKATFEDIRRLYQYCYEGKKVDFGPLAKVQKS